jgi:Hint module
LPAGLPLDFSSNGSPPDQFVSQVVGGSEAWLGIEEALAIDDCQMCSKDEQTGELRSAPILGDTTCCPNGKPLTAYHKICPKGEGSVPGYDPLDEGGCPAPCFCEFPGGIEITSYGRAVTPSPDPGTPSPPGSCFSETAPLFVHGKGLVAMKDAHVGDMVRTTSEDTFEPLYAFGHLDKEQKATFLKITTDNHNSLEITAAHLVYLAGKDHPIRADSIKVGDKLQAANGLNTIVKEIGFVEKVGLYAPLVPSGKVWVDGVLASSYIALQGEDNVYFSTSMGSSRSLIIMLLISISVLFELLYAWESLTSLAM